MPCDMPRRFAIPYTKLYMGTGLLTVVGSGIQHVPICVAAIAQMMVSCCSRCLGGAHDARMHDASCAVSKPLCGGLAAVCVSDLYVAHGTRCMASGPDG